MSFLSKLFGQKKDQKPIKQQNDETKEEWVKNFITHNFLPIAHTAYDGYKELGRGIVGIHESKAVLAPSFWKNFNAWWNNETNPSGYGSYEDLKKFEELPQKWAQIIESYDPENEFITIIFPTQGEPQLYLYKSTTNDPALVVIHTVFGNYIRKEVFKKLDEEATEIAHKMGREDLAKEEEEARAKLDETFYNLVDQVKKSKPHFVRC